MMRTVRAAVLAALSAPSWRGAGCTATGPRTRDRPSPDSHADYAVTVT